MPRGDRTGPRGQGPRTGRGLGYCEGYDGPGCAEGRRRSFRRRRARTEPMKRRHLPSRASSQEEEIENVEKRLGELEEE